MGLLEDVLGKVKAAAGGKVGEQSSLADGVLALLSGGAQGGGLQDLVRSFTDKGLGEIVSSWISTGRNLPISADQLKTGLGADVIGRLASSAGVSAEAATSKLTELLPTLVDKLTPDGNVPESGLIQQALERLRGTLPKG